MTGGLPPQGPVFHVGLPKTGTTFLQERFFPGLGIPLLTTHRGALPASMSWIFRINGRWLDDRLPREERRRILCEIAHREIRPIPEVAGRPSLVSAEGLCGVSHDPLLNSDAIAGRLAQLHPGSRAVLCVRDHADWCESIYRQLVLREDRFGRFLPFERCFSAEPGADALVQVADLRWSEMCAAWIRAFGVERVLILRYEELRDSPSAFLGRLSRFVVGHDSPVPDAGMRVNDSSSLRSHRATPLVRKALRLAGALACGNLPRAAFEWRTFPRAVGDRLRDRRFAGITDAVRAQIDDCARPDTVRLAELLSGDRTPRGVR